MHSKVEAMACKNWEIYNICTTAMSIHVPKHINGQHLYEQAKASTAKSQLWRV